MQQIDAKSVQFLKTVRYYGGEANISEIRSMTGLTRNEANYRFRKLLDMDLIDITTESSPGELEDRKVAHLTGKANRELERGLGGATKSGLVISDEPEATEVSRERFKEMEQKLDRLAQSQQATCVDIREVKNLKARVSTIEEDLTEFEMYVYEWHESAEMYLRAIRQAVEDKLGVSLTQYFKSKEDN